MKFRIMFINNYMQINGKWDDNGIVSPLNIHTGICKTISADSLITYSHNSFGVLFSEADFSISENKTTELTLDMNINQWFTNPVQYDFRVHGPGIMEDELAQLILQANGWNVFITCVCSSKFRIYYLSVHIFRKEGLAKFA